MRRRISRSFVLTVVISAALGAGVALGVSNVVGTRERPGCVETVMKAVSTDQPVHGSYECFNTVEQAGLSSVGIDSDQAFAVRVGQNGEYHFVRKTADGGYVYEYDRPRSPHDRIKGTFAMLGLPTIAADLRRGDLNGAWSQPNDFRKAWSEITGQSQNEASELFTFYIDGNGKIMVVK